MQKSKSAIQVLYSFDTEDNSKGMIYWVNFFDGKSHYSFQSREAAIEFLDTHPGKYWATNLEYDLINIFVDKFELVDWHFGKSKLIWARYKRAYFFDSLNHWKMSVEEMGKYLGFPKKSFDPKNLDYCQRDTEITFRFVEAMSKKYEEYGVTKVKSTIASTALHAWNEKNIFNISYANKRGEHISIIPKDILERFRLAYYGGRTEAFYIGKVKPTTKKGIFYVDVNSMYPFSCLGQFPNPYHYSEGIDVDLEGVTSCSVRSDDLAVPVLPYRNEAGRLIFPNGAFRGTWTNLELRYFKANGGRIEKTFWGYTFPLSCEPFTDHMLDLYTKRKEARDDLLKITGKNLMNNLYGKFAEGCDRVYVMPYEKFVKDKRFNPNSSRRFGDIVSFSQEGDYPWQSNFIWPAYVTSRARVHLHKFLKMLNDRGDEILYCDTDSIIFKGTLAGLPLGKELGDFKLEAEFNSFDCKTAKMYKYTRLQGDEFIKCKGVPSKHQKGFFENGSAEFQKPVRLRESLVRDLRPNVWMNHKKAFVETYNKGTVTASGRVVPFKLRGS